MKMLALLLLVLLVGCAGGGEPGEPGPVAGQAELRWAGTADLDLELWTDSGTYDSDANDWGTGAMAPNCEKFAVRSYGARDDVRGGTGRDFAGSSWWLAVTAWRADQPCTATVTLQDAAGSHIVMQKITADSAVVWRVARWNGAGGNWVISDTLLRAPARQQR
ncbi:MAG TPA: hypothetical protein PKM88_06005 [bacterium]|nr:hypothetical protein [bacterium]